VFQDFFCPAMPSAIAVIVAGTIEPPSYWASFRAAKIDAAITLTLHRVMMLDKSKR
jgi:hypothetical protein